MYPIQKHKNILRKQKQNIGVKILKRKNKKIDM